MNTFKKVLLILWVPIGVFNYALMLGSFTHEFPDDGNMSPAVLAGVAGPIALGADLIFIGDPHFQLKPYTKEHRWEIFHQKYPHLTREDFESYE